MAAAKPERALELDGWRGVALLLVIVGHFFPFSPLNMARVGVELFFVLSGRLMADILFVQRQPLPAFVIRRISRVWPALLAFVIITSLVFSHFDDPRIAVEPQETLAALTLTLNYFVAFGNWSQMLGHVWSLCVEEHSYVLLALTALLAGHRMRAQDMIPILAVVALAALANGFYRSVVLEQDYYQVFWRTDVRAASIFLSACLFLVLTPRLIGLPGWIPVAAGIVGTAMQVNPVPDVFKYSLGTCLLAVSVCTIGLAPAWCLAILRSRFLTSIGLVSFSLYLWQEPFAKLIDFAPRYILLAATVSSGLLSFYLIEQPARRYLNRRWTPGRSAYQGSKAAV